jgi:hypothetical protein
VTGLMAALEEQYGVELSMLSSGVTILYSDFMDKKKREARKCILRVAAICGSAVISNLQRGASCVFRFFTLTS